MANPNPHQARQAKRRASKPGTLPQLQLKLWQALCAAEAVLQTATEAELTLKAVHAMAQVAGHYARLLEVGEIEARLAALEAQVLQRNGTRGS
jgi:hypothetical protein